MDNGRAAYTKAEAALALGVSVETIDRMRGRGELRSVVVGARSVRIPRDEIDRVAGNVPDGPKAA